MANAMNMFGGMDMDSSPRFNDGKKYFKLMNGEVISDEYLKSGAIQNVKGNAFSHEFINDGATQANLVIIGAVSVHDYVVYFTTSSDNGVPEEGNPKIGQIHRVKYNEDLEPVESVQLYTGLLDFNTSNPVFATGRYLDDSNIKVYFVDGYNVLRFVNIMDPDISTQLVDEFEIIGKFTPSDIEAKLTSGGSYKSGSVSYAYQLINYNGVETVFSPTTTPYHISSDLTNGSVGDSYKGDLSQSGTEDNTGNGFKINIENIDEGYGYIRLVALYYESFNSTPEVRIIYEGSVTGYGLSFFDDGIINEGSVSFTEFATVGLFSLTPSLITNSSTRLAVGNVKEEYLSMDFDARAYRFDNNPDNTLRKAKIKASNDSSYILITPTGEWSETGGASRQGVSWSIPENYDCVNFDTDVYKYQKNGVTIGGSGKDIEYNHNMRYFVADKFQGGEHDTDGHLHYDSDGYVGYANEQNSSKYRGYRRNETYRFGLVGYNKKGLRSYVQWVGDIKMPNEMDTTNIVTYVDNSQNFYNFKLAWKTQYDAINIGSIYLTFNVHNLPNDITQYQIVRERRTLNDRSIVSQGLLELAGATESSELSKDSPALVPVSTYSEAYKNQYNSTASISSIGKYQTNDNLYIFIGPEVSYDNLGDYEGDVIVNGSYLIDKKNKNSLNTEYLRALEFKASDFNLYENEYESTPVEIIKKSGSVTDSSVYAAGSYRHYLYSKTTSDSRQVYGRCGTSLVISYQDKESSPVYDNSGNIETEIMIDGSTNSLLKILSAYIRRNLEGQYGGNSYAVRLGREYIQAGEMTSANASSRNIYGGDTFVGMFEYLRVYALAGKSGMRFDDNTSEDAQQTTMQIVRFPVESSINVDARAHENYGSISDTYKRMVQEKAGVHTADDGVSYTQDVAFYSYNTAYSKENDAKTFYTESTYQQELTYDKPNTIYISNTANELNVTDSWLKFLPENATTVDGTDGELSSINGIFDKVVFIQASGVGYININPNTIIPTTEEEIVLGSGSVASKPIYSSSKHGSVYTGSSVAGKNGVYFIDEINKSIMIVNGQAGDLSEAKGVSSYLNDIIEDYITHGTNDDKLKVYSYYHDNKVYFIVRTDVGNYHHPVLVYNEITNTFESLLDKKLTEQAISHKDKLLEINSNSKGEVWLDKVGEYGKYYEVDNDMVLEFIVNEGPLVKIFDNIEFNQTPYTDKLKKLEVIEGSGTLMTHTFNGSKLRFRKFRANIPKISRENSKVSDRYMNDNLHLRLTFDNSGDESINIFDMITHYRSGFMPFN